MLAPIFQPNNFAIGSIKNGEAKASYTKSITDNEYIKFLVPFYKNMIPKNVGSKSIAPVLIESERLKTKDERITLFLEYKYKHKVK